MKVFQFLLASVFIALVAGDCYMQTPRGSNDRLNEANTNRNNGNRVFDSQNNAKGGYCVGPRMRYYEGSLLIVEWTTQHGCGSPKLECNVVLQFMCTGQSETPALQIRDGTTTDTITADTAGVNAMTGTELTFGMHENLEFYQSCQQRNRNMGLFVADRVSNGNLNGVRAVNTRQNNNGNRNGLECPEERDYYPYWHPTPWRDIAFIVDSKSSIDGICDLVQSNSQNVVNKGQCIENGFTGTYSPSEYNNRAECSSNGGNWQESGRWGIPAPECLTTAFNRDNHLGNGPTGFANSYNWTLPGGSGANLPCLGQDGGCACVLRIRYNISTNDYDGYGRNFVDFRQNGEASPIQEDPTVDFAGARFTLAIDTTQFGRTFQDRTHTFDLIRRSGTDSNGNRVPALTAGRIYNLNVRGKRGNIVQTYPATEYDFAPESLTVRTGDYIHFQWTGCDTNPDGNAGEGTSQTDRSNIVQVCNFGDNLPMSGRCNGMTRLFPNDRIQNRLANLDQNPCPSLEQLLADNNNNQNQVDQDVRNCFKLNAAPTPYFDGGVQQMRTSGDFHFMSSRNNNFSNRGQKGNIVVNDLLPTWAIVIVALGAAAFLASAGVGAAVVYSRVHPGSSPALESAFNKLRDRR